MYWQYFGHHRIRFIGKFSRTLKNTFYFHKLRYFLQIPTCRAISPRSPRTDTTICSRQIAHTLNDVDTALQSYAPKPRHGLHIALRRIDLNERFPDATSDMISTAVIDLRLLIEFFEAIARLIQFPA